MESSPRRTPSLVYPVVVTLVWVPASVVGAFFAMMSVMFFDAPGSTENPWTWTFAGGIAAFPALCVASVLAVWPAWLVARRWAPERASARAWLWGSIAALPLLAMLVGMVGFLGLTVFCGGSFAC